MPIVGGLPKITSEITNFPRGISIVEQKYRYLIIAQKSSGSLATNTITQIISESDAISKLGEGSEILSMYRKLRLKDTTNDIYVSVLPTPSGGVANTYNVVLTGTATESGTLSLWINGKGYQVSVASGDTAESIATVLESVINNDTKKIFTVQRALATLTVVYNHTGTIGNYLRVIANYLSSEKTPAGLSIVITNNELGAGTVSYTNTIQNFLDTELAFKNILLPYADTSSLLEWKTALETKDLPDSRLTSYIFTLSDDTVNTIISNAESINSKYITIGTYTQFNHSMVDAIALFSSAVNRRSSNKPVLGHIDLTINDGLPYIDLLREEKELLLQSGVTTFKIIGSTLQIADCLNTNTTIDGNDNLTFNQVATNYAIDFVDFNLVDVFRINQGKNIYLAEDGYKGDNAITIPELKAGLSDKYSLLVSNGDATDLAYFNESLNVEVDSGDSEKINATADIRIPLVFKKAELKWNYFV